MRGLSGLAGSSMHQRAIRPKHGSTLCTGADNGPGSVSCADFQVRSGMERVSSSKNMASNPTLGDKSFTSRAERPTAGGSLESAAAWDQLIDSALNTRGVFGTVEDGHLIIRSTSSQLASMQRVSSVRSNGNAALGPDLIDLSENSPASGDEDDESSSPSKSAPDQSAESTSSATGTALANLLDMGASSGSATSAAPPKEKRRVPAWTDRILWRNGTLEACPAEPAQQLSYSHALLTASDHRPVSAAFSLKGRKLDAILVLRIQDGNDIFLSVAGAYCPSFFGVSLACLASLSRKLTTYLRSEGRLSTVGLFVNSADHALTVQGSASSSGSMDRGGAKAIRIVREAMDRGLEASAASSLLADALAPVEWAVFRHITSLMRDTLAPGARDANGLTPSALAALLAEVWFAPLPRGFGAAGRDLKPENVTDLQKMAEGVSAIAERRAAFITLFLDEAAL
ncbi:hypothetical protein WJX72_005622 [[Myrmecia] bisecta]|uniref:Inositol polyphosphate-related phosphatase domain-containing protein n=1 Tax=[Myrmecia] bisecta TaxID=41462 RepID=A0AAW1PWA0_9CHLO